jgi:hypothetical protein
VGGRSFNGWLNSFPSFRTLIAGERPTRLPLKESGSDTESVDNIISKGRVQSSVQKGFAKNRTPAARKEDAERR